MARVEAAAKIALAATFEGDEPPSPTNYALTARSNLEFYRSKDRARSHLVNSRAKLNLWRGEKN